MKRSTLRIWLNVVAVILTIGMNALAVGLPLNGQSTGAISDSFKVYFVPAGYVFSIWGLIYLGLILYAIYQALPSQRENTRLARIDLWFIVSSVANMVWLVCWHFLQFPLSMAIMLVLLVSLLVIYLRLGVGRATVTAAEKWLVHVPFSIYLGWITVATVANASDLLYHLGWNGGGLSPMLWAVIMLVVATALAVGMALTRRDIAYGLVLVWAFIGIAVKQAASSLLVAISAGLLAAVIVAVYVLSIIRKRQQGVPAQPA